MVRDLYYLFVVSVLSAIFPSANLSRCVRGVAERLLAHTATRHFRTQATLAGNPKLSHAEALQKSMLAMIDNAQRPRDK
jgi:hypothetical protein